MDFVLDLLQGAGIAAAIGIRPFLPFVLAAALAAGDLGLDFDGTDFSFLEEWWFVVVVAAVVLGLELVQRRREIPPIVWALLAISVGLGALMGAGSLADHDYTVIPGIVAGALCAWLGWQAARSLFGRVRARLDPEARSVLPLYSEGAGIAVAGLSILFPPLAIVFIGGLAWLLLGGRRRAGEKYAGLRILR